MAVIKCKMCGGDLVLIEGQSVAECEYCGSRQTVPAADNEKKLNLFARANRLRLACEFDKAAGIYEAIVADFPEEAETYWGLVLCKYGIEYVDDPATGKKIPTCHRSSFDSVMDDSNFEQAMENADELALRVYRQEAKQIETIRKGILEVSSSEKPYDIFICYKETDSNGDRTVDSLLAQDIYDALTSKGYRVFFSRITLEDKLGQAYEPYIFAALNSAKIMLAVGTCYEHYNAVWVKNEWSRYLKIVAQDKSKYLIPCYKGLDAYDMPKEFAHLQGQDMGKVGAIADLLRGIEKLMPRQKSNTVIVQEKVVVGNAGGSNKIASLLDRGNMALEDGDWAKADSFFEDVLNNDSKNAQAYLGKTLAQERCRTVDALVRKRRDVYQNVSSEKLYIQEKSAHIGEMAEKYSLPGYVEQYVIRDLYKFDLNYTSEVAGRQKQYREEENWWQNHRWLSRAEKFAVDTVARTIQNEKKHLFAQLADRVKKAQEADARAIARLEATYDAHIAEADKQAEQLYNDGLARRDKDYQTWLDIVKTTEKIEQLKQAEKFFKAQKEYKDSKNLAEHCHKRVVDITAELEQKEAERRAAEAVETEKRRIAKEKAAAVRKKRNTVAGIISGIVAVAVIAVAIYATKVIIPANNYAKAEVLLANGDYVAAAEAFEALGGYKDSAEQKIIAEKKEEEQLYVEKQENAYNAAMVEFDEGHYQEAQKSFNALGEYKNSKSMVTESTYQYAVSLLAYGYDVDHENISTARDILMSLGDYKDSAQYLSQIYSKIVSVTQITEGSSSYDYDDAKLEFRRLYNEYGQVSSYRSKTGEEVYTFNEAGQLIKDYKHTYEYDTQGNIARKYSDKEEYTYTYDQHGNEVTVEYTNKESGYSSTTQYSNKYANGLLVEKSTSSNGMKTIYSYEYDKKSRLVKETKTEEYSSGSTKLEYKYTYDSSGRLIQTDYDAPVGKDDIVETYTYGYIWAPKQR